MKNPTSVTFTGRAQPKAFARALRQDGPGAAELARSGARLAQALNTNSPNINVGSSETVCVRYALVKKGEFCGHRRNDGGGSYSVFGAFEHARIWARESDAARYREKRRYANVKIVAVTVALGRPYAIFTESEAS
jgi:hypothetical protein